MTPQQEAEALAILHEVMSAEYGQAYQQHLDELEAWHTRRAEIAAGLLGMPASEVTPFGAAAAFAWFEHPAGRQAPPRFRPEAARHER